MKVAINIKPLLDDNKFRGVGFYTRNLLEGLKKLPIEVVQFSGKPAEADVVHYPFFDLFFHTLPISKKLPTMVTIHDVIPLIFDKHYPVGIKGSINLTLQRISLKNCKKIITDSEVSKKDISKYLKVEMDKIEVIPLAAGKEFKVLSNKIKKKVKSKLNLPDNFLLYVGDTNYVKNIPYLIKEFTELIKDQKFSDFCLVLVGKSFTKELTIDHPELKPLKETNDLINKLPKGNILRLGFIETDDLVGLYNLARVYIQPSLYEGFGLSVLEAMACGCPVICANKGSLLEVGGEAVIYFDPQKEGGLSQAVIKLLSDKNLTKKLIEKGLVRAKYFSWDKTADQTIKVYEKVLKRS